MKNILLFLSFSILKTLLAQPIENSLFIDSKPQGAEIKINDDIIGKTPLNIQNPEFGEYKIRADLSDYISREQIINYQGSNIDVFFILDGDYGIIEVKTNPDSAKVIVNGDSVGITPIDNFELPLGLTKIKIMKDDYFEVEKSIRIRPSKFSLNTDLQYKYGFISNSEDYKQISLKFGGKDIRLPLSDYPVVAGENIFEIYDTKTEKYFSHKLNIESNSKYDLVIDRNFFTAKYILMSTVIPGFGQFMDQSYYKGIGIFTATSISTYLYYSQKSDYDNLYKEHKMIKQLYIEARDESEALELRLKLESKVKEVNSAKDKTNSMLMVLGAVYTLNLLDAIIFHHLDSKMWLIPYVHKVSESIGMNIQFKL